MGLEQDDCALAGLAFRFSPVNVKSIPEGGVARGRSGRQAATVAGADRAQASSEGSVPSKSVAFNLQERRPGAAYGSPNAQIAATPCEDGNQQVVACARKAAPAASTSLAALKLATLRRRAAAVIAATTAPPASASGAGGCGALPAGLAAEAAACPLPEIGMAAQEHGDAAAQAHAQPDKAGASKAQLLQDMEGLLAGCDAAVLQEPLPSVSLPRHVLLGLPVLAVPPLPKNAVATTNDAAEAAQSQSAALEEGMPSSGHQHSGCTRDPGSAPASSGPGEVVTAAAGPTPPATSSADPTKPLHAALDLSLAPATVEEALLCLGLLAREQSNSAGSGGNSLACRSSEQQQQELWVQLHAVRVVMAAKCVAAVSGELAPLVRRLRQVRLHLEFHKANVQRARSRSPRRSASPAAAPQPGPWLSGRSSAQVSKHKRSQASSPRQGPRPKVSGPTPEASELQVQLLTSLQHKLLLKLGVATLRQAAAAARLQTRLLLHVQSLRHADLCCAVMRQWRAAAVPSQAQVAASAALGRELALRRQHGQLAAWHTWAAHRAWQKQQLAVAHGRLRRRLLCAAVQHWRCLCQQELVRRLQAALATRWVAAWAQRRAFTAWRQAARRCTRLKAALLLGRPCGSAGMLTASEAPRSQLDALAATAEAFKPVKAFVAEAVQQLGQLKRGLRFTVPSSSAAAAAAAAAAQAADAAVEQLPWTTHELLPLGSVESVLALLPPPRQSGTIVPALASSAMDTAEESAPGSVQLTRAAEASLGSPPVCRVRDPAAPAPDPGSPVVGYNPASYASPQRLPHGRRQQQRGSCYGAGQAVSAAALQAELLACQEQVEQLRHELEALEQESADVQQQCTELEAASAAAHEAVHKQHDTCRAAAAAKEAAAAAMQAAIQQHAAAAAKCAQLERQLRQRQQEGRDAMAAAAGARAAAHAAAERRAVAAMGVQKWTKAVEAAAKELSACHRTQQGPVLARLKDARQELERQQQEVEAARQEAPALAAAAQAAAKLAEQAQQAVLDAQQQLVVAAEQRAARQRDMDAAMGKHEAAAVASVAAQQEASAVARQPRLLAAQQQAAAACLQQAALQAQRKQAEALARQEHVQLLQQRHQQAVAAMLAEGRQQQQEEQLRRVKLKRRLQVVAGEASALLASPSAAQQRRPPPAASGLHAPWDIPHGDSQQATAPEPAFGNRCATSDLALCVAQRSDWSCCSSELGSPEPEDAGPALPLTVDEAAARFRSHYLVRHALRIMRQEAASTRAALHFAEEHWKRRQQVAALLAWHAHAAQAADWLQAAGSALRRRWLLRRWQAVAAEQRWEQHALEAADDFACRRLSATALHAWTQHMRHERWRDAVHEAVVRLRMRNMLSSWRAWTRQRRQKAARQRAVLAVHHRRLALAALRHWLWLHRGKALLRRVFGTAVELWEDEVGARLHERNHERLQACWSAWQLAVLEAQALRRQAILWNAAAAFREKQLLLAGLQAFRRAAACAHEERRMERVRALAFARWRQLAASSARHWECVAARRQRQRCLLRAALSAWRAAAEATAEQLAHFWLRWQVQAPLRRALLGWRWAARERHEDRVLRGMADVHCERRLLQAGLGAFSASLHAGRERQAAAASSGGTGSIGRRHQQQHRDASGRNLATVCVSLGSLPYVAQQRQQGMHTCGEPLGSATTTITISRGQRRGEDQEQVPPEGLPACHPRDAGRCVAADSGAAAATAPTAVAAQGMLDAVYNWRAAADFWRQRHADYRQQSPQAAPPVVVSVHTAATLAELRAHQQQQQQQQQHQHQSWR